MRSVRRQSKKKDNESEKTVREWERLFPDTWILLEVTEQDNSEPVRGKVLATGRDPEDFQDIWKKHRANGVLTMLTFGPPLKSGPSVVASAA